MLGAQSKYLNFAEAYEYLESLYSYDEGILDIFGKQVKRFTEKTKFEIIQCQDALICLLIGVNEVVYATLVFLHRELIDWKSILKPLKESLEYCTRFLVYSGNEKRYTCFEKIGTNNDYRIIPNLVDKISSDSKKINHKLFSEVFPIDKSAEDIFFDIHCRMRDIDGLHSDECLDELCKIIYMKLFDEESLENESRFEPASFSSQTEYASNLRALYSYASSNDIRIYSLKIPNYTRSRGVFHSPIKLSDRCLSESCALLSKYNISASAIDVKGRAFQKVLSANMRSGMGQYFTPFKIGDSIVEMLNPSGEHLILDPFCGSGHFLSSALAHVISKGEVKNSRVLHEFLFNHLHGIEKSDRMVRIAMTDMRLNGDGHSNIRCTDALLDLRNYPDLSAGSFDIILTNPPFGSLLSSSEDISKNFTISSTKRNVPLEVLAIERCWEFLRPGGRIGIVLPDGILTNKHSASVRDWIIEHFKVRGICELPVETFAPFGANVRSTILIMRKWRNEREKLEEYKIFICKLENVGYEANGKEKKGSELPYMVEKFAEFIEEEGW